MRQIACPVVRKGNLLLVFRHPLAGVQLIKGGIDPHEDPAAAALRELSEESGITGQIAGPGFSLTTIEPNSIWTFTPVRTGDLPHRWRHHCADDGGHDFSFFWHPADAPLSDAHPQFERARQAILAHL